MALTADGVEPMVIGRKVLIKCIHGRLAMIFDIVGTGESRVQETGARDEIGKLDAASEWGGCGRPNCRETEWSAAC